MILIQFQNIFFYQRTIAFACRDKDYAMIYFLLSKNKEINYHLINIDELLIPKSITAISKSRFRKSYLLF